ncbi:MAG: hypothetical protein ACK4N4_06470 [Burkholderiales bacterium]
MDSPKLQISALAAVLTLALAPLALAGDNPAAGQQHRIIGEKLDSSLGQLPHYSQWAQHPQLAALVAAASHVPGESLDSGLGELPHYSQWASHPQLAAFVASVPGEKLDSGLGQLPHYSQWGHNAGRQRLDIASHR